MRALLRTVGLLLVVVVISGAIHITTPDTDPQLMLKKYGGDQARFAVTAAGARIHYRDQGSSEHPVLVLVHGSSSSLHTWEPVVSLLQNRFRLLSMDLPGHGLTGPHPDADYTAKAMTSAVLAVMDDAGVAAAVWVGNSMGGWVSWRSALSHPERVRGLVLLDSAGAPFDEPPSLTIGLRLLQTSLGRALLLNVTPRSLVEQGLRETFVDQSKVTDQMTDRYWELLRYPGNRQATLDRGAADREPEKFAELASLKLPTLLLWGAEDTAIPILHADKFAEKIPHATLTIYSDVGHLPMEEIPEQVAADIERYVLTLRSPQDDTE